MIIRTVLLLLISTAVFSQDRPRETEDNKVRNQQRLLEKGRLKQMRGYMDSVRAIRAEKAYQDAQVRIEKYRSNADRSTIREIDLSNARLDSIPAFVWEIDSLEILVLNNNSIAELPRELASLPNLKKIYWKNNKLGERNVRIPRFSTIEKLDLSGNDLTKVPNVQRLKGLKELVLENNEFTKLPVWRGWQLKELEELDMSGNPVLLGRRWYWLLKRFKILKLNKCGISEIHPAFYKMSGLEELQVQVNDLKELPEGISGLSELTKLSFYKNGLSELPDDFFDLSRLEVIDLYYNSFEKIPQKIGKLTSLKTLYLSFNKIYDLPASLGELTSLEELYIHHNRISEIPESIGALKKLRVLHFQETYVAEFPTFISRLESLQDLDISNTYISEIPSSLARISLLNFYWRNLEIAIDNPGQAETRDTLLELQSNGTNVVPTVEIKRLQLKGGQ